MTIGKNVRNKNNWLDELQTAPRTAKVFIWDYRDQESVRIKPISDVHWGHKHCDTDLIKRDVDWIGEHNIPFMDLGDLVENATKDSVGAGVYEQEEIAQQQIEEAVELYKPVKHLLKCMHPGNHEIRTMNTSGINLTKIMAKMLDTKYAGAGAVHYVMVGNQRYVMYTHHGGSGATTIGGKMNALLRMEKIVNADIYIQGHTHDTIYQSREFFELNRQNRTLESRKKHFVNNGAYLDYWGTYGQVKAYSPGTKGTAILRFDGTKHDIGVKFK